jgi:hypothetical protein
MENLYAPPESVIEDKKSNKPNILWKLYFWLILVLEILDIISEILAPTKPGYDFILDILIYPITIVGIFGFVYQKKILFKRFWLVWLPILFSYDIYGISTFIKDIFYESKVSLPPIFIMISVTIIIVLLFFQYMALLTYALKSKHLWNR